MQSTTKNTAQKQRHTFTTDRFQLRITREEKKNDVTYIYLHATDRFHGVRHKLERNVFRLFTRAMESYLRKHPEIDFDHPRNVIRKIIYLPPAFRSWAGYMPGGFATYHVHNPDHKRLVNGKRIDYITRSLFKHASDPIGLRSRAYAMTWFVHEHARDQKKLTWLSIACGTGQPTFDAARVFDTKIRFVLADLDDSALEFAQKLAHEYAILPKDITTTQLNITHRSKLNQLFAKEKPSIIDAMGLFEYLDDTQAVRLLEGLYQNMLPGDVLVYTNMHTEHPQLHIHKRGLGWPGVIQRTDAHVCALMRQAGIAPQDMTVLLPDDKVYGVYGVVKSAHK